LTQQLSAAENSQEMSLAGATRNTPTKAFGMDFQKWLLKFSTQNLLLSLEFSIKASNFSNHNFIKAQYSFIHEEGTDKNII
jgi:hypothetical protein